MITVKEPISALTAEVIKGMVIHTTLSSLRRACAVKESQVVPATDELPQLVYVAEANGEFSIHAMSTELTRFLMLQSIATSTETAEEEQPASDSPEEGQE
jgi:hypothetical protein